MAKVDKDKLEDLIQASGLGSRSANKLREANEPRGRTSGHGAASQDMAPLEEL